MSAPPDRNKSRETVNLDHCHQTGPVSGGTENVCQNTKCPKCGTLSAYRIQTKPFWEGGIPMSIYLYKNNQVGHTSSRPCHSVCPQQAQFTVIPKQVKLMAVHKDLRSHQYLDDWLVRARSHQVVSNIHRN